MEQKITIKPLLVTIVNWGEILMKEILLDGKKFTSKEKLHDILKSKLNLPDYYGRNLDALWDCITGDVQLPISIVWTNFENSKEFIGDYAEKVLKIFLDAADFLEEDLKITVQP